MIMYIFKLQLIFSKPGYTFLNTKHLQLYEITQREIFKEVKYMYVKLMLFLHLGTNLQIISCLGDSMICWRSRI